MRNSIIPVLLGLTMLISACGERPVKNDQQEAETAQAVDLLAQLRQQAEKQPDNAMIYNEMALYFLSRENFSDALHNINISLELEPSNTAHYITLSDIYLMMGDAQRAQLTLYRAMELEPASASIYVHLGRLQVYMEDYPRAFENLRKALELDRNNSSAYFWRGIAWLERGDTTRAISDWQLAVAYDPESFDGYFQLGMLMAERKDRFALDYLDHALRLAPSDPELIYDIGMAFQEIERYNKAIETYNHILSIDPCFYKALYNKGYISLVITGEYEAAIRYFGEALDCKPDYADALFNRGLAYELLEDYANARKDYRETLLLRTNYPKAIEALNRLDEIQ